MKGAPPPEDWKSAVDLLIRGQIARLAHQPCVRNDPRFDYRELFDGDVATESECDAIRSDIIDTLRKFRTLRPHYAELTSYFLRRFQMDLADDIFMVKGRTKDVLHLARKICRLALPDTGPGAAQSKRPRYVNDELFRGPDLGGITDLAGLRVVLLYRSDYKTVDNYIRKLHRNPSQHDAFGEFGRGAGRDCLITVPKIVESTVYRAPNDRFQYDDTKFEVRESQQHDNYTSFHYTILVQPRCGRNNANQDCGCLASRLPKQLYMEIQVRTLLEEVWAEIEHRRNYHGDASGAIRRQLHDLKAVVDTANSMIRNVEQLESTQREVNWKKLVEYGQSAKYVLVASKNLDFTVRRLDKAAESWVTAHGQFVYFTPNNGDETLAKNLAIIEKRIEVLERRLRSEATQPRKVTLLQVDEHFFRNYESDRLYLREVPMLERGKGWGAKASRAVRRDMYVSAYSRELARAAGDVADRVADEEVEKIGDLHDAYVKGTAQPNTPEELRGRQLVTMREWFLKMTEQAKRAGVGRGDEDEADVIALREAIVESLRVRRA